jgi:hypothetical protein
MNALREIDAGGEEVDTETWHTDLRDCQCAQPETILDYFDLLFRAIVILTHIGLYYLQSRPDNYQNHVKNAPCTKCLSSVTK